MKETRSGGLEGIEGTKRDHVHSHVTGEKQRAAPVLFTVVLRCNRPSCGEEEELQEVEVSTDSLIRQ